MRLEELLAVVSDNLSVLLWNANGCGYITEYNGKDSIDKKYNSWLVINVASSEIVDAIDVTIKEVER